jgi:hypothetical protein
MGLALDPWPIKDGRRQCRAGAEGRMGRIPIKGWLLLMLGASRAPLSAEEARAMRKTKAAGPEKTTVVVLPPKRTGGDRPHPNEQATGREPR